MNDADKRRPTLVGWGITDRCNLSCAHCYSARGADRPSELSTEQARAIIDALGDLGAETIGWTGGEPLLRQDIEELAAYARARHNIRSAITTNGLPLTPRRLASLRDAGVYCIQVSLDGSTAQHNSRMRGAPERAFQKILDAVVQARELGFEVHLAMLVGAETLDDARSMIELARAHRVRSLRFCGYVPWGRGAAHEVRQRLDWTAHRAEVRRLALDCAEADHPLILFDPAFGPLPPHAGYHDCVAGRSLLYLDASGDVYPCTSLLSPGFRVGNALDRPLRELWDDPEMTRMSSRSRARVGGACRTCRHFERCGGGCRGIAFAWTGDLDAGFPNCLCREDVAAGDASTSPAACSLPPGP